MAETPLKETESGMCGVCGAEVIRGPAQTVLGLKRLVFDPEPEFRFVVVDGVYELRNTYRKHRCPE